MPYYFGKKVSQPPPPMAHKGFSKTTKIIIAADTAKRPKADARPKIAPKSQKANKNHFIPI
jgi:hypothetical protein